MERFVLKELVEWKTAKNRKPLLVRGARQVGKTYILKEFGRRYFENFVYFNFDENKDLNRIFETSKTVRIILDKLALVSGEQIRPETTLIILDEIQLCSAALNSLKYFKEDAREYVVVAAGSLLGMALDKMGVPVGQVNIRNVYPLTFAEYLFNADDVLYRYVQTVSKDTVIDELFHNRLIDAYRVYLTIGGLPEVVQTWIDEKNPKEVARLHEELAELYEADIMKHHGEVNADRILLVYRSIVKQLAKENKKFIYGAIKSGARAREFETAIEWLVSAGLVNRVYCATQNVYPIKAKQDLSAFKLYLFDTGLLKYMAGVTDESLILDTDFDFKGAIAENYVCQQLIPQFDVSPMYFMFGSKNYEIDYLLQYGDNVYPVEVKASGNVTSPSSRAYKNEYSPEVYIHYSALNFRKDGTTLNIPLYLINRTAELL